MHERFVIALFFLAGVSTLFVALAWRKRHRPGGTPMVVFHVALTVGALAYAGDITTTTLSAQLRYRQIATVAQSAVAISWLYAALQYADFDRPLTRRVVGLLALDPLVLVVGFLVPDISFFDLPATGGPGSVLHAAGTQLTPLFLAHMGTILVAALAGTVVLVRLFLRSRHLYRTQSAAVLVAALAPWTIALTQQYFLRVPEDATIFAWGLSGVAITAGLYTFKTLDPVPAAQSTIVETMGDGTLVLDTDGRISDSNPAARALLDDSPLLGRPVESVVDGWDAVAAEGPNDGDWAELSLTVDGRQRYVEVETTSFTDRFDDVVGTLVVLRDITDRKRREQRLEQYKLIFDSVAEPVYVLDSEDRFVRYNESFAQLVGEAGTALVDEPITVVFGPEAADAAAGDRTETTVKTGDGDEVPCELDLAPVALDDGLTGRVGIIRDISRRKAIESELAQTTERLQTLVEASPLAIIVTDSEGVVDIWNPAATELFGWTAEEVVGEFVPVIPDAEMERARGQHDAVFGGESIQGYETELLTKSGERIDVSFSAAPVRDDGEAVTRMVSVIADIGDRKAREAELRRKNARLDEFAGIVSHDLRNPLSVATGAIELAAADADEPVADRLATATNALDRMEALIDHTLALAREGRAIDEPEPVALADTFGRAWDLAPTDGLRRRVRDPPETVHGDEERLTELFANLVRNATEHAPGSTVTLGGLDDGFYVADDGPGIPPADRDAVLESGYSTAEDGTGFGLAIVATIADAHGWTVSVTESEDGGARFEFRF